MLLPKEDKVQENSGTDDDELVVGGSGLGELDVEGVLHPA